MSDFKAKMHQIRFPLGPRPRHRWGAYSAPTDLAVFKGREGKRGEEGKGKERKRVGEGKGGESCPPPPWIRQ